MSVDYEWVVEELDEFEDIINCIHFDTLNECWRYTANLKLFNNCKSYRIGLVFNLWNNIDGDIIDRAYAYLTETGLPTYFKENGRKIPKRFHKEVEISE